MKKIPFNDLSRIHRPIHEKVFTKFSSVVEQNRFVLNKEIGEFESLFSDLTHETELSPNPVTTVVVSFINDLRFIKSN